MASKGIKGITIELNGDTTGLERALKDVNKESKDLQSELKDVEKALKWDPSNVELVRQKQELLAQSVQQTSKKLETLRTAQQQVEQQFRNGQIGEEQYRSFQRELVNTEAELRRLESNITSLNSEQERLGQTTNRLQAFFEATGTDVEQFADTLGTRLTQSIRDGSASADQMEKALRLMGRQALGASTDIDELRRVLNQINDGGSLDEIRQDLNRISDSADEAENKVGGFGDKLAGVAGALVAGGGIAGIVDKALDASGLDTKIDISFGVSEESKQSIKEVAKTLETYGVDGEEALEGIRRQWALNKDASDELNGNLVKNAGVVAAAYQGLDFIELIQEVNEMGAALEVSNEDALALTNSLLKAGFPPEQLDTIAEYGTQMKEAGFSVAEIQSIFEKGIDTKTWNIDNLNDGVKEARLQMATFGTEIPKALEPVLKNAGLSKKQFLEWGKAVAEGGTEGSKAMAEVVTYLDQMEEGTAKNDLATAVFATKWEDQGQNMISVFQGISDAQDKTAENQSNLNDAVDRMNQDPMVALRTSLAEIMAVLTPLLLKVGEIIGVIANWISKNSTLAAVIASVVTVVGIIIGILAALAPIFSAIGTIAGVVGTSIAAIAAPIGIAIAAIAALIAIGVALWKNWDEISAFLAKCWEGIKKVFSVALNAVKSYIKTSWETIKSTTTSVFNSVKSTISNVWANIKSYIATSIANIVSTVRSKFTDIVGSVKEKMFNVLTNVKEIWGNVKRFFNGIDLKSIGKNIIQGLINGITAKAKKLVDSVKGAVNSAIEGAKNLLGIHSPSRVFMEFGEYTNEGFIKGIESTSNRLNAAVDNVYGSLASSANKSNANQIAQTQIINNNASSMDLTPLVAAIQALVTNPTQLILDGRVAAEAVYPHVNRKFAQDSKQQSFMRGERI